MKRLKKSSIAVAAFVLCCLLCTAFAFRIGVLVSYAQGAQPYDTLDSATLYNTDGKLSHRVLVSGSGLGRIAVVDENNNTRWELLNNNLWNEVNDADMLPNGDLVYCASKTNDCAVRLITPNYTDGTYSLKWQYKVPDGAENHTCQPIDRNGFLLCEAYNDYIRIVELDADGNVRKLVGGKNMPIAGFSDSTGGVHGKVRQIFKTDRGTYLLSHFSKPLTIEIDDNANILNRYDYGGFTARKLSNGNVLISGGDYKMVTELTEAGELVWQLKAEDIPDFVLSFPANITRLPNGNTVIANWLGHGVTDSIYPVAEITPDKKIVWGLESGDTAAVSNFMILDDLNLSFTTEPIIADVNDPTYNYRSPLDTAASVVTGKVYVADYTNKSIQVIDSTGNQLVAVIDLPAAPNCVFLDDDGKTLYVAAGAAEGEVYEIDTKTNNILRAFKVGHTPNAIAGSQDGKTLYAANRYTNDVSVIDLSTGEETGRIAVTREPMGMVRFDNRLYVGGHLPTGSAMEETVASEVVVVDLTEGAVSKVIELPDGSTNLKDMAITPDGEFVYVTHALGRYTVATTHLDRGWVYTNAISEIATRDNTLTATVMLDDMNEGAANPWGVAATYEKLYVTAAGTGELIVIDRLGMREKIDGVTDGSIYEKGYLTCKEDITNDLTFLVGLKKRIPLMADGPRGVALSGEKLYVANYYSGNVTCVNTVNPMKQSVISFATALPESQERLGEKLWNDATLCFQKWQSCASCHPDARVDGLNWDNLNDGIGTPKQAKSMLYSFERGRVMATGIRPDTVAAIKAGFKYIMFNADVTQEQYDAVGTYLRALQPEDSPYLVNGVLSESAERGRVLFYGKAGCAECHSSDIKSQDILVSNYTQTGNETRELTVVPLVEVWRTAPYAYDGRFASVSDFIAANIPAVADKVSQLTEQEKTDLTEYILSLSNSASLEKPEDCELGEHDLEKTWSFDESGHWHACSGCPNKIDFAAHTPGSAATETTAQTCTVCGYEIAPALGHTHRGVFVPEVPATAEDTGTKAYYKCDCGNLFSDENCTDQVTEASLTIPKLAPTLLEGNNGRFKKNSATGLTFKSSAGLADFLSVSVDGAVIDESKYTKASGSTIITLKPEYLDTLSVGDHTLTITSNTGEVNANFTIEGKSSGGNSPSSQTGDSSDLLLWVTLMIVVSICVVAMIVLGKNKKGKYSR